MIWLAFFVSIIKKNSKNSYFVLVPKSYQILSNNLEKIFVIHKNIIMVVISDLRRRMIGMKLHS